MDTEAVLFNKEGFKFIRTAKIKQKNVQKKEVKPVIILITMAFDQTAQLLITNLSKLTNNKTIY